MRRRGVPRRLNPPGTGGIFEGTPTVNPEENIMKVVLVNGSPHAKGCTFTALAEVADTTRPQAAIATHTVLNVFFMSPLL